MFISNLANMPKRVKFNALLDTSVILQALKH